MDKKSKPGGEEMQRREPAGVCSMFSPHLAMRQLVIAVAAVWRAGARWRYAWAVAGGLLGGLGLLTFQVGNAASYLTDDPKACINCHIMTPYYASWERSSHKEVAVCNDCHVPQENVVNKLAFKAMDGMRHSTMFTLRLEPQVLILNPAAVPVVQSNCVRCHEHQIMNTPMGSSQHERLCWDCHRETPHGLTQSLSSSPHVRRPRLPSAGIPTDEKRPGSVPGMPSSR
jgi:cytochrome c nitrite reductase small subunit